MAFRLEYQCCYCEEAIGKADRMALSIVLSGLRAPRGGPTQQLFAHARCAAEKFGANLSPSVPFDVKAFEPD